MNEFFPSIGAALLLGVQTSISPCPMAASIAAISYVGRRVGSPRRVFWAGLLYTLGGMLVYTTLGITILSGLLSAPVVSIFLQKYVDQLLGPILIVVAMFLLGLFRLNVPATGVSGRMQKRVDAMGIWGAGLLGILFALAFCPVTAVLFFLGLIPLAVKAHSSVIVPSVYGIGAALPVFAFAILIAIGAGSIGKAYDAVAKVEHWARRITGLVFLLTGLYFSLRFVFYVF